jgi:hypothetical protein
MCRRVRGVLSTPWGLTVSASCTPWVRGRLARSRPEIAGIAAVAYLLPDGAQAQHFHALRSLRERLCAVGGSRAITADTPITPIGGARSARGG